MALLCGLRVPLCCLDDLLRQTVAGYVEDGKHELRIRMALFCRCLKKFCSLVCVFRPVNAAIKFECLVVQVLWGSLREQQKSKEQVHHVC